MAPVLVFIDFHTQANNFCLILNGNIHTHAKNFLSTWIVKGGLWNHSLLEICYTVWRLVIEAGKWMGGLCLIFNLHITLAAVFDDILTGEARG